MADQGINLGVSFDMVPGMDGKTWARMTIVHGMASLVLALPPDVMSQLVEGMYEQKKKLMKAIKEYDSPIVKPNLADLQRFNGKRQ